MKKSNKQTGISWEISVPLINNYYVFRASLQAGLLIWAVMAGLLGLIFAATGEFDVLWQMLVFMAAIAFGFWLLMLLVMLVFFGNRMEMRFAVKSGGVTVDVISKRSKAANRLLIVLGILTGKPGAIGAGLIASTQERQTFEWERVYAARYDAQRQAITLRNRWRSLVVLFCLPENYDAVAEEIKGRLSQRKEDLVIPKNPLTNLLSRTALTVLACVPFFQFEYPFKVDLFLPIFIAAFALATIWLIPLFGYVVICAVAYLAALLVFQGLQVHTCQYDFLGSYRGYELINGDEWAFVALVCLSMSYLVWSSWRAVKGREISALFLD